MVGIYCAYRSGKWVDKLARHPFFVWCGRIGYLPQRHIGCIAMVPGKRNRQGTVLGRHWLTNWRRFGPAPDCTAGGGLRMENALFRYRRYWLTMGEYLLHMV